LFRLFYPISIPFTQSYRYGFALQPSVYDKYTKTVEQSQITNSAVVYSNTANVNHLTIRELYS